MGDAARLGGNAYHRGHVEWAETTVSVPDLPLPLPGIERAFALTVLLSATLGALAADVLLTLRPFSRHRTSRPEASLALAMLIAGCLTVGAFADRSQTLRVAAAAAAAAGALAYWAVNRWIRNDWERAAAEVLSDDEMRRDKAASHRWVLVTGPVGAGKTALIEGMIDAAADRMGGLPRSGEDGALRVTEVAVRDRGGAQVTLRLWEARSIRCRRGPLPPLADFDAVVLVVDPTQHALIADSFPDALRDGRKPADANDRVLQLAGAPPGGRRVWAVVTKADRLRFSVHPPLLESLPAGPGWHERVRGMDVTGRRPLAVALDLGQFARPHEPAFAWGRGSPLFAYAGDARREPFGARDLVDAILDTL